MTTMKSLPKLSTCVFKKSKLLGYATYADYVIEENMAKTPDNVYDFLMKLWNPALPNSKKEVAEMQKIIDREGGNFKLQPWDWWYYAEKVRKEKFDLDESALAALFQPVKCARRHVHGGQQALWYYFYQTNRFAGI